MTAVMGTIGLTAIASQVLPQDPASLQAIILIGLAVGVDYSLFYVRREREERAAGRIGARRSTSRRRPPAAPCSSPA